jgi:hypothetical protein
MKLRLMGTADEVARVAFLLRFGPPELRIIEVSPPRPNRGDSDQVRVYLEARLLRDPGPAEATFYSLTGPDGRPVLVDAWGNPVPAGKAGEAQ